MRLERHLEVVFRTAVVALHAVLTIPALKKVNFIESGISTQIKELNFLLH
jgi:hypothetical protein